MIFRKDLTFEPLRFYISFRPLTIEIFIFQIKREGYNQKGTWWEEQDYVFFEFMTGRENDDKNGKRYSRLKIFFKRWEG